MELKAVWIDRSGRVHAVWRIVLYLLLAVSLGLLAGLVTEAIRGVLGLDEESLLWIGIRYVPLCIAVLVPAIVMLRFFDHASWRVLGIGLHSRMWLEVGQGLAVGFVLMTAIVLVGWGLGALEIAPAGSSSASSASLLGILGAFVILLLASAFEELLFRGYAFQVMIQGIGRLAAVGVTALLFGWAHWSNPNASWLSTINTALAGVLLAVAYLETRSLWLPTVLHLSWNFSQGVVYGLPVSGIDFPAHVVTFTASSDSAGPDWLTGGAYGPEGGLLLTVGVVLAIAWVIWSPWVRAAEEIQPIWLERAVSASRDPEDDEAVGE